MPQKQRNVINRMTVMYPNDLLFANVAEHANLCDDCFFKRNVATAGDLRMTRD